MASYDVSEHWPLSLLHQQPKRVPTEEQKHETGYGALQAQESSRSMADSLQETWQAKIFPNLPKTVDIIISCLGLSLTLIAMLSVESWTGFRLYSLSMSASGIIFFAPQSPPQLQGFFVGTASAATISWALFTLLPFQVALGLAAGVVMLFYKSLNVIFPPAAVLGVLISQETERDQSVLSMHDWWKTASFVLSPWLSGHAVMYTAALALSEVRRIVRRRMMRDQLAVLAPETSKEVLWDTFSKFDTSGDGYLDADELRVALRVTRGADVTLEQCVEMIGSIDSDGDGVISFDEFVSLHAGDNL